MSSKDSVETQAGRGLEGTPLFSDLLLWGRVLVIFLSRSPGGQAGTGHASALPGQGLSCPSRAGPEGLPGQLMGVERTYPPRGIDTGPLTRTGVMGQLIGKHIVGRELLVAGLGLCSGAGGPAAESRSADRRDGLDPVCSVGVRSSQPLFGVNSGLTTLCHRDLW